MLAFAPPVGLTLQSIFAGGLAIGDVNLHPSAKEPFTRRDQVGYGNPYHLPVPDKTFASLFAVDTLEHLERPDRALYEWHRVAEQVFLVVPSWWSPDAWMSKWYIDPESNRAWPLWVGQNRAISLPRRVPREYDAGTCPTPTQQTPRIVQTSTPAQVTAESLPPPPETNTEAPQGESSQTGPELDLTSLPRLRLASSTELEELDLRETESDSDSQEPYLPPFDMDSSSSMSVSSMMIVSGPEYENS